MADTAERTAPTRTPGGRPRRRHCTQCRQYFEIEMRLGGKPPDRYLEWPQPGWFCSDECMWTWIANVRSPDFIASHWHGSQKSDHDWIDHTILMQSVIDALIGLDARLKQLIAVIERTHQNGAPPDDRP